MMNRGTNIDSETDVAHVDSAAQEKEDFQTRRRLRKALALAERFKQKYHLEQQVSSELARRCDDLKTQGKADKALIDEMRIEIRNLQTHILKQKDEHSTSTIAIIPESKSRQSMLENLEHSEIHTSYPETLARRPDHTSNSNDIQLNGGTFEQPPPSPPRNANCQINPDVKVNINTAADNKCLISECRLPALRLFEHFLVVGASYKVITATHSIHLSSRK